MHIKYFLILLCILAITLNIGYAQRIVLQAEDAKYTGKVDTQHAGYTGTGFVDTNNDTSAYIQWEFSIKTAAIETLYVFYAHGKSDNRTASVIINDCIAVQSLSFPPTGSFTNWTSVSTSIPVRAGMNVLKLKALTSGGLANCDRIEISGEPGTLQYKLTVQIGGRGKVEVNPAGPYYDAGSTVTLTAVPVENGSFLGWSGALTGTTNPATLVMNGMKSVTAEFQAPPGVIYLSPNGNDDTGDGTDANPIYSLSKAVSMAQAGDIIYLYGGTYYYTSTVLISKKGTEANPFKVLAVPGEKPILNYSQWAPANSTERGLARGIKLDTNAAYWYFKGIEICYAPDNGVKCEGDHTTFEQCVFHHNGDSGIQIGLNKEDYTVNPNPEHNAAYTRVINCDSYRNADPGTDYENADGFACKLYAGKGNYFYGCRAWENCDDGWDCYQSNELIVIENCWTWHNGDPSIWGFSSFNGDGNGFKLGGDGEPCPITIKNCVAFDSPYGAMSGFNDNNNGHVITVLNCVAWLCGRDYNMQDHPHILKNCVSFNNTRMAPKDLNASAVQQNNSWNLTGITASADDFISISATDAAAPREGDGSLPNNGFAKLKSNSDLIDKGVDVGIPFSGSAPDLGAYEYNSSSSVTMDNDQPKEFALLQNYPNPFNPSTNILYQIPNDGFVVLKVYNLLGQEIKTLVNSYQSAGSHSVTFDAQGLASGLYFYRLNIGGNSVIGKMNLIR